MEWAKRLCVSVTSFFLLTTLYFVPIALLVKMSVADLIALIFAVMAGVLLHELLHIAGAIVARKRFVKGIGFSPVAFFVITKCNLATILFPAITGIPAALILQTELDFTKILMATMLITSVVGVVGDIVMYVLARRTGAKYYDKYERKILRYAVFFDFERRRVLVGDEIIGLSRKVDEEP